MSYSRPYDNKNNDNKFIAPLSILSEDEWGDLECLHKARQAATTDGGLFTAADVYMNEVKMNDRVKTTVRWTVSKVKGPVDRQELVQTRL